MIEFIPSAIEAKSTSIAKIYTGWWLFAFSKEKYYITCHTPYIAGAVHNYIYRWNNVNHILPKRSYMMNPSAIITKDNNEIPVSQITLQIDWNSWCWFITFQLLGKTNLQLIRPSNNVPVELKATINDHEFNFYVEKWNESYSFGNQSFTVQGRGLIAELDEPYFPQQNYYFDSDQSAKQIVETILDNTGWEINWRIEDWLIKAKAFSFRGTPIRAIQRIVQAQDGIIYPDRKTKTLHVLKKFKVNSWNLAGATPDVIIPQDVTISLSQEFVPQISYFGCILYGTGTNNVGALVKRAGTNGQPCLNQITDDLFTDTAIVNERGRIELCKYAGPYYRSTILLPLFPKNELAFIDIGSILQYSIDNESMKGIVTGIQVRADWTEQGLLTFYTLEVLRWL